MRHAKSSWDDDSLTDFDRPLNDRGERDAPKMAKRLKERDVHPDRMISSPANRALTTCMIVAHKLGFSEQKIEKEPSLYHASAEQILKVLKALKSREEHEVVLIFGHNPGLTDFANKLLNENIMNVPTSGVVYCTLKIHAWNDLAWGAGVMDYFDYPKK